MTDIHSCSYYCDRPECVKAQRDELRAELERLRAQEPAGWTDICGAVARGWCHPENARKEMDSELALAIADEVQRLWGVAPPAQPAQRLTDEQIDELANDGYRNAAGGIYATCVYEFARAIESALAAAPKD